MSARERELDKLKHVLGVSHELCGALSDGGMARCWRPRGHKGNHAAWIYEWKRRKRKAKP